MFVLTFVFISKNINQWDPERDWEAELNESAEWLSRMIARKNIFFVFVCKQNQRIKSKKRSEKEILENRVNRLKFEKKSQEETFKF